MIQRGNYLLVLAAYAIGIGYSVWRLRRNIIHAEGQIGLGRFAALIVVCILWPLWFPFVGLSALLEYLKGIRGKEAYRMLMHTRSAVQGDYERVTRQIAQLSEALCKSNTIEKTRTTLQVLDTRLRERLLVGRDNPVYVQLSDLYSRHRRVFNRDPTLGGEPPPMWKIKGKEITGETGGSSALDAIEFEFRRYNGGGWTIHVSEDDVASLVLDIPGDTPPPSTDESIESSAGGAQAHAAPSDIRLSSPTPDRLEWEMLFAAGFKKSVRRLDKTLQGRVLSAILEIIENPIAPRGDTVKPLSRHLKGMWRYRIGDYRVVYLPKPELHQILFLDVAAREGAYQ